MVTAGGPPDFEPPPRSGLPDDFEPEPPRTNLALVALVAFAFGVLLHGCVALSILDSGSSASGPERPAPVQDAGVTVEAGEEEATPTRLPDRTTCAEIQGTGYRSTAERDFYRANCIPTPTPQPSATPAPSPTATQRPG